MPDTGASSLYTQATNGPVVYDLDEPVTATEGMWLLAMPPNGDTITAGVYGEDRALIRTITARRRVA